MSNGSADTPCAPISLTASPWNAVVPMSPAGVPRFANAIVSWRLHDVHDPQSAEPAKTTSHAFASSSISSGDAGVEALAFFRWTTAATP
jgi:hypothetical protein